MAPKVTFIVPCYNLAHYLAECVESILSQTYKDFEILIMDDCSPDSTPEVAQSFNDSRVIHVRNDPNLRHLANYNKGIGLAKGEYIWLISADDRLRRAYVLERYVQLMDNHPDVGFVFCPAMAIQDGKETDVERWSSHGAQDFIFKGTDFLVLLLQSNCVTAPCGMVRKKCYEIETFPLDLPYAGDWYLWCLFSLHYGVAYFGEAMVNYRLHDQSFTSFYLNDGVKDNIADEINVRWRIMMKAEALGNTSVVIQCKKSIAHDYAIRMQKKFDSDHRQGLTVDEFEQSILDHARNPSEKKSFRAEVFMALADRYYWKHEFDKALPYYKKSIHENPARLDVWAKLAILSMGRRGFALRNLALVIRKKISKLCG